MIKFVLVFITVILMILGIYTYSNQSTENNTPAPTISKKKTEVKETKKVSVVTQKVKEKKSSPKNTTVKSSKAVSQELTQKMDSTEEIGKGLTLESIENANVSEEEKELLIADMVSYQTKNIENVKVLTFEEGLELIANDVKNGIIK